MGTSAWWAAGAALGLALLGWACVQLTVLVGATRRTAAQLHAATVELGRLGASLRGTAEIQREDQLRRQARRIAFVVSQTYAGDPDADLPGAVVVRVHNAGDEFVHSLIAAYIPQDGDRQATRHALLPPQSTIDFTFRLYSPEVKADELGLLFTDSRGTEWSLMAGAVVAHRVFANLPEERT